MIRKLLDKFLKEGEKHPVRMIFLLYTASMIIFVLIIKMLFKYDSEFFLTDDGYYTYSKLFMSGNFSLLYAGRGPGIPLLFSWFHIFPEYLHAYLRLGVTMSFVFLNIYLAKKIFDNYFTEREVFIGLIVSVFNPIHIHFTVKSTPEVYILSFFLLLILLYGKLAENNSLLIVLYLFLTAGISLFFKPVLFFVPFLMFLYAVFLKEKKLYLKTFLLAFLTFVVFIWSLNLTAAPKGTYGGVSYGGLNFIGPTFIPRAMLKTGRFSLDANASSLTNNPDKSVAALTMKYHDEWMKNYLSKNPDAEERDILIDYIKENFGEFVISKLLNIVFFVSLASNVPESVFNLFLSGMLLVIFFRVIKEKIKIRKKEFYIFIFTLSGYLLVYLLTFGYARYSIPFIFVISVFSGVLISKKLTVFLKR